MCYGRQLYHSNAMAKAVMVGAANPKALYEVATHRAAHCGHAAPAHWLHAAGEHDAWSDGRAHLPQVCKSVVTLRSGRAPC